MNNCLSCFLPLKPGDSGSWHRACSRRVFGVPVPPQPDLDLENLPALGLALLRQAGTVAGVQKKLSADRTGPGSGRLTLRALGGRFLLKPPVPEYPHLPENEALCMELARRLGIPAAPHGLLEVQGKLVYVTRRFDRGSRGEKIPQEDFCQLSGRPAADKYKGSLEAASKVLRWSGQSGLDRVRLLDLSLFCWLTGNADMHLKNYSLYSPSGIWELTPAYDLVSTALALPEDREETALSLNGKKAGLALRDWEALADSLGVPRKVLQGLLKRFRQETVLVETVVHASFLPPEFQKRLLEVWNERLGRMIDGGNSFLS